MPPTSNNGHLLANEAVPERASAPRCPRAHYQRYLVVMLFMLTAFSLLSQKLVSESAMGKRLRGRDDLALARQANHTNQLLSPTLACHTTDCPGKRSARLDSVRLRHPAASMHVSEAQTSCAADGLKWQRSAPPRKSEARYLVYAPQFGCGPHLSLVHISKIDAAQ